MTHVERYVSAFSALKLAFWLVCYLLLPCTMAPMAVYNRTSAPTTPVSRRSFPVAERVWQGDEETLGDLKLSVSNP